MTTSTNDHLEFIDFLTLNLKPLLAPFFKTTVFGYRCFDKKGKSFGWSNNQQWNHFFIKHLSNTSINRYELEASNANNQNRYKILRIGSPCADDKLSHHLYQLGIWNTIGYYVKCANFIEGFYFSNTEGGSEWINYCLNQSRLLEQYQNNFKEKLLSITNRSELLKFAQPTISPNIFSSTSICIDKKIILTTREQECLQFITEGYTNKEIARQLNLSPRTIEWYVDNIKTKAGVCKRIDLMKISHTMLEDSPLVRFERKTPNIPRKQPNTR